VPGHILTEDHAALALHFPWLEENAVGKITEDAQPQGEPLRRVLRQIDFVTRLTDERVGVDVRAEAHALALKRLHQFAGGEMPRAVERHVLDEVRVAALLVALLERAGIDEQAQADLSRGLGQRVDRVAHAILEAPLHDTRAQRQKFVAPRPVRQRLRRKERAGDQPQYDKENQG